MSLLFSFLTSAYRTERYVAETIESVLAQTRTDWELIVVDNGNSDEMARIVESYTGDSRIKLIRQENKGVRGGVAAAADVAVGRYLCVLNSDDILMPDFCMQIGSLIDADAEIDAVGCDGENFRDPYDGRPPQSYFAAIGRRSVPDPSRSVSVDDMLNDGVPLYIGAFRRDMWEAHRGYDPAIQGVEADVALWLSMAADGRDIRVLPDRLARIRVRGDSVSRDPSGLEEFERRLLQAFLAVGDHSQVSEAALSSSRMVRHLRTNQAMRKARWALFDGDVPGARASASDAYRIHPSLRTAAVIVALRISPGILRSIHPAVLRTQNALRRARLRIANGTTR
jgi:glycosyltransferase involved in cell wall biosynthesis